TSLAIGLPFGVARRGRRFLGAGAASASPAGTSSATATEAGAGAGRRHPDASQFGASASGTRAVTPLRVGWCSLITKGLLGDRLQTRSTGERQGPRRARPGRRSTRGRA